MKLASLILIWGVVRSRKLANPSKPSLSIAVSPSF